MVYLRVRPLVQSLAELVKELEGKEVVLSIRKLASEFRPKIRSQIFAILGWTGKGVC